MRDEREFLQSITAVRLLLRIAHLRALLIKANFDPNQPRIPRGRPDGGRWTNADGLSADAAFGGPGKDRSLEPIDNDAYSVAATCAEQIAAACKGSVLREFPSQYLDVEIDDVRRDAASGNAAARKALKLMFDKRFQK